MPILPVKKPAKQHRSALSDKGVDDAAVSSIVLAYPCTACSATPGAPCTRGGENWNNFHRARVADAAVAHPELDAMLTEMSAGAPVIRLGPSWGKGEK